MAIGRLSIKVGKAGKAGPHAAYIARSGEYGRRLERGEKLEATEAGNLPAWAAADPLAFWRAADAHERANGTTYREMEIALPRELDAEQRAALVRDFVCQEIGDRHAYQWAIHTPRAADGQDQPHAHLMFSERQRDGIERDPEQYFRRYNAKAPEKGGARKGYGPSAGRTLTQAERAAELKALRGRWAEMANRHLEQAGRAERIEMRSHAERGTGLEPEAKQLPSQWRGQGRAAVIEFRQARRELAEARAALGRAVPDAGREIAALDASRQRPVPDPLAGFRARVERAEADGGGLALDVAKAQLAVAQEFQADGKDPRHHGAAIAQEGQNRAFAALALEASRERPPGRERPGPAVQSARFRVPDKKLSGSSKPCQNPSLASSKESAITPLESTQSHETRHPVQREGETLNQAGYRLTTAFFETERDAWREQEAARHRETAATQAARRAELQRNRPWLFGRDEWAREVAEAARLAGVHEIRARDILAGDWDHPSGLRPQWEAAADRRLAREYPELRKAMDEAAARKQAEREARTWREQKTQMAKLVVLAAKLHRESKLEVLHESRRVLEGISAIQGGDGARQAKIAKAMDHPETARVLATMVKQLAPQLDRHLQQQQGRGHSR